MKPEEKARVKIDRMFEDAGWNVVDREHYAPDIHAAAIKEGLLKGNLEADYFLFLNGQAIGVLEAKREEADVASASVCAQAEKYARNVPDCYRVFASPLPIIYQSNGTVILFKDYRNPDSEYQELTGIHTPKEIVKMLGITDDYAGLPTLQKRGLRDCQYEAITKLEKSFRAGQNRALMVLATGSGKTYTACMAAYRMLSYTPMKRILFLVDRNNLGKQAETEFGTFRLTENDEPFNTIFAVERLKSAKVPSDANVVISTIQRLFSLLKGEDIDDVDDDGNIDNVADEVSLPANPMLSPDFFDMIIIDECHRSIYGNWRKVLDYFGSARMVGLTATPAPETLAFFNNNRIVNYTLERSIADGVNVDYRIYRIKTHATEDGGAIREGENVKKITRYTGAVETIKNQDETAYTKTELNRSIVNPAQIKLVLETYRDVVYSEMFADPQREPNMNYLPKTLIFALNDAHASNIVKIAKEVFGRTDDRFVQKITYSAGDSNELIRQFRNNKDFRIAVTVTLVATGTDVKPLEVVMFMRDVESDSLYTQMKGRGVRTIGDEQLRNVTPNAFSKDLFYLVDAVGVTEHEKKITRPSGDDEPTRVVTLKELLERIVHGNVNDEYLRLLAARLSRIYNKSKESERNEFFRLAKADMKEIAVRIYDALESGSLPPYTDVNELNNERWGLVADIANSAEARRYLQILNAGFVTILQPGKDALVYKGFSIEEAYETTAAFEKYVDEHKDEIEALRIIYNNREEPITYVMLKDLENRLKLENTKFNPSQLWNTYALIAPESVVKFSTREEKDAITNIIQLVRYAFHQITILNSLHSTATQYFNLWCGQTQRSLSEAQKSLMKQIVAYIGSNGSCTIADIRDWNKLSAARLIHAFGDIERTNDAIVSLSQFLIYRKTA